SQAAVADGVVVIATRDQQHVVPVLRQPATHHPADGAGPVDHESHVAQPRTPKGERTRVTVTRRAGAGTSGGVGGAGTRRRGRIRGEVVEGVVRFLSSGSSTVPTLAAPGKRFPGPR